MVLARLADRFLRTPALARAPIHLFDVRLGWVFGGRMLMLEHTGRKSGQPRQVVLEVIERPAPGVHRVVSGLGRDSQWFRNISVEPRVRISVGRRHRQPATAAILTPEGGRAALEAYAVSHPRAWATLEPVVRRSTPDGEDVGEAIPVIDIHLDQAA